MINYQTEKEGQINFYDLLRKFDNTIPTIENNTDGIILGTILEFKLSIANIHSVLFQAIKYLSRLRNLGKNIPSQILLVSLNNETAYLFKSNDFLSEIEKQYTGGASKNNNDFSTNIKPETINYKNNLLQIIDILKNKEFIKVHVDEHNIVGLSKSYYEIINDPKNIEIKIDKKYNKLKLEFVEELIEPKYLHIFPFALSREEVYEKSKKSFPGLIDCLNDKFLQKELGAFYTPNAYVKKATELLRLAISKIPEGNDYIILDRCAGTGQLENFLSEEELSHCVLSTYETWEWNVLYNKFIDKVRLVIPPEASAENSLVSGGDALSEHFILGEKATSGNQIIMENLTDNYKNCIKKLNEYVANPNCNIIIFENPPYRDMTSNTSGIAKKGFSNFVKEEMKKEKGGALLNDIANLFIWSAWKFYIKKENDFLLLFSPIKYWKSLHLFNKKFIDGYGFNRKHFHAGESFISFILWQNIDENRENLKLKAYDIENDEAKYIGKEIEIKKVYKLNTEVFYEKRKDNNIGYLRASSFNLDPNSVCLTTVAINSEVYSPHGFYLQKDNFINKLPLFCAKLYPQENWYEKDVYFTTADKGEIYLKDKDFLKSCLIYTCLTQKNKCLSFMGSDGRFYRNELCFSQNTLSDEKLKEFTLNNTDKSIISLWENILEEARKTKNYENQKTYGLYQIIQELNTYLYNSISYTKDELKALNLSATEKKSVSLEYVELNTKIDDLKKFLKDYYKTQIQDKLFEYELLK